MTSIEHIKGDQRFIITYEHGEEPAVLNAIEGMTCNPDLKFDWADAATMAHMLVKKLIPLTDSQ